jgi:hypothetical protein
MRNLVNNKKGISPLWIISIAMCFIVGVTGIAVWQHSIAMDNTTSHLEYDGFQVVTGYSNSPAVVQTTSDYHEFIDICHSINTTTIFKVTYRSYLVVANETYGCELYVP